VRRLSEAATALCPTNFSLSLQPEWKFKYNDKLKFVALQNQPSASGLLVA
jgi:hypothetical protein